MEQLHSKFGNPQRLHLNLDAIRSIGVTSNSRNQIWVIETNSSKLRYNCKHLGKLEEVHSDIHILFIYIPLCCNHGIKQGGVLSPYLFAVYLDELSIQLGSARVGCTVGNMVVNHLMFADDISVFRPSISGLQCLLNICGDYAAEHKITFNCNKTIGVLFTFKKLNFAQKSINNLLHQMFF